MTGQQDRPASVRGQPWGPGSPDPRCPLTVGLVSLPHQMLSPLWGLGRHRPTPAVCPHSCLDPRFQASRPPAVRCELDVNPAGGRTATRTSCNGISTPALTKLTGPRDPLSDACVSVFEFSVPQLIHEEQGRKLGQFVTCNSSVEACSETSSSGHCLYRRRLKSLRILLQDGSNFTIKQHIVQAISLLYSSCSS